MSKKVYLVQGYHPNKKIFYEAENGEAVEVASLITETESKQIAEDAIAWATAEGYTGITIDALDGGVYSPEDFLKAIAL